MPAKQAWARALPEFRAVRAPFSALALWRGGPVWRVAPSAGRLSATMTAFGQIHATSVQPRAEGSAAFAVQRDGGRTRLATFRQQGSLKVLWPRGGPGPLEAVVLNTAGGLTGGDRMALDAAAGPGAHLVLTTQAAERAYRAQPGQEARVETRLRAAVGARIDWLPQETILYDGAALHRCWRAGIEADASLLAVEPLILGRRASGERVTRLALRDRWELRRDGRLVLADAIRLEGDAEAAFDRAAVGGGARALATILFAGAAAEVLLPGLRACLPATAGASLVREGVLFARLLAADGFALRAALVPAITHLTGRAVPKVWRL